MYDGILLDVDGVLLRHPPNHPAEYEVAVRAAFGEFDVDAPPQTHLDPFYGEGKDVDAMRSVLQAYDFDLEAFWPERERQASALQRGMVRDGTRTLFDDADVVHRLADSGPVGLVSNNQRETIEFLVGYFDFADAVSSIQARDPNVEGLVRGKPDPHYLQRAIADVGTDDVLFVGDRASDVVAADRAGVDAAYLRRNGDGAVTDSDVPLVDGARPAHQIRSLDELERLVDDT